MTWCSPEASLAWKASPYLFPCTIEYSLIAAAVVYKMYRNVGSSFHPASSSSSSSIHGEPVYQTSTGSGVDCDKANKGLFLGLFVTVLTLVAVSCYFVLEESISSTLTFFSTEVLLLLLLCIGVIVAFFKFQQLESLPSREICLDSSLLVISLVGVFALECFHLVCCSHFVHSPAFSATACQCKLTYYARLALAFCRK